HDVHHRPSPVHGAPGRCHPGFEGRAGCRNRHARRTARSRAGLRESAPYSIPGECPGALAGSPMKPTPSSTTSLPVLCRWALGYAWRRGFGLVAVLLTLLLKVGIDLLKPWPFAFLVDYVLQGKSTPLAERIAQSLPGPPTTQGLILWSVAATAVLFLLS